MFTVDVVEINFIIATIIIYKLNTCSGGSRHQNWFTRPGVGFDG